MGVLHLCGRPECGVTKTGVCAEGHAPPQGCPSYGQLTADDTEEFDDDLDGEIVEADESPESTRVALANGEALVPAEVDEFLLWKPVNFVTIVGDFDSGKTTLICALYDRFLKGQFAEFLFAGSRTIIGFEKRSHHSRVDSGRTVPDTLRTSLAEGLRYFHFSLVQELPSPNRIELMLSDRAGEHYKKARSNSVLVDELIEVKKGHYIVLLLDGARLADPIQRSGAMQSVRQTIRAFLDAGALKNSSRVQIVTTKLDILSVVEDCNSFNTQLDAFKKSLLIDFASRLGELTFWDIAARDPEGNLTGAYGLDALLRSWCVEQEPAYPRAPIKVPLICEFDRLLSRTPAGELI